ncbi:MAG: hypothetical protein HY645_05045 [Acidobacteria bacterium]|nr:hypothetical protein [Acidobacteriota bacterium]
MRRINLWVFLVWFVAGAQAFAQMGPPGFGQGRLQGYQQHELDHNLIVPQLAVGDHYQTSLVILNLGNMVRMANVSAQAQSLDAAAVVYFFQQDGTPLLLSVNGAPAASEWAFTLSAGEMGVFELSKSGADVPGWALIEVEESISGRESWGMMDGHEIVGGDRLSATVFYTLRERGQIRSRVAVLPSLYEMGRFFNSVVPVQFGAELNTGVAIVNSSSRAVSLRLNLRNQKGQLIVSRLLELEAGHQTARFIDELFRGWVPFGFHGFLEVVSPAEGVVTLGLLMSEGVLTSVPTHHHGIWNGSSQQ